MYSSPMRKRGKNKGQFTSMNDPLYVILRAVQTCPDDMQNRFSWQEDTFIFD